MPIRMSNGTAAMEPLTPERRRQQTRQHLLEAAATVFSREGFHGASLDEVAAAAGFTKGAVYSNFKSKDDLFVAVLDDRVRRQFDALEDLIAEQPDAEAHLSEIRQLISTDSWDSGFSVLYLEFVLYAARNPDARETLAAHFRRVREAFEQLIARQWERLGIEPDIPPRSVALIGTALMDGLATYRLIEPDAITDATLDSTLAFFAAAARGLGAPI